MAREQPSRRRRLSIAISNLVRRPSATPALNPESVSTPQSTPTDLPREPGAHLSLRSQAPHLFPDRASLSSSAHPQRQSPLFAALPAEIRRLIYGFMWRTGGHEHGIHLWYDRAKGYLVNEPCMLAPAEGLGAAAEANRELDEQFRRLEAPNIALRDPDGRWGALEKRARRNHRLCQDEDVYGPRNAARWRGQDSAVIWVPFLPVLLTCKKVYLEAIDTIFQALPPVFCLNDPSSAHAFLAQDPHPSTRFLRAITLYSDHRSTRDFGPGPLHRLVTVHALPLADDGLDTAQWECVLAAMARLPALREVRLTLRFGPTEKHDLRPLARWAGAELARKFTVDLYRAENWQVPCSNCGGERGMVVVPGEETDPGDGEEPCPVFGKVNWYEELRYTVERDQWPAPMDMVWSVAPGMCWHCTHPWEAQT
ncbi:uncharacterized protein DNG_05207 [Cephalotrichum gorgonifer]|uniref:DUF7730 domain-containing protein n=1 Tax=Cephalotrichum gorgonifer TaxID=2041049 RepID=A0AAE8SVK1_9PEZI|nr:uncharacterized protein DNG_05207 [Cephalotrichum gorgonifer]